MRRSRTRIVRLTPPRACRRREWSSLKVNVELRDALDFGRKKTKRDRSDEFDSSDDRKQQLCHLEGLKIRTQDVHQHLSH